jgi:hypothetical protein
MIKENDENWVGDVRIIGFFLFVFFSAGFAAITVGIKSFLIFDEKNRNCGHICLSEMKTIDSTVSKGKCFCKESIKSDGTTNWEEFPWSDEQ